jgi:hypothetical protein
MNYKNMLIVIGAVAVVVPLVKMIYDRVQTVKDGSSTDGTNPKVKKLVSETLKQHEGEDSPFVHAFAQAVT